MCSRHFKDNEIKTTTNGKRMLFSNAVVPSLFEWNNFSCKPRAGVWERRRHRPEQRPLSPEAEVGSGNSEDESEEPVPMVVDHCNAASSTVCLDLSHQRNSYILCYPVYILQAESSWAVRLCGCDDLYCEGFEYTPGRSRGWHGTIITLLSQMLDRLPIVQLVSATNTRSPGWNPAAIWNHVGWPWLYCCSNPAAKV